MTKLPLHTVKQEGLWHQGKLANFHRSEPLENLTDVPQQFLPLLTERFSERYILILL